MKSICFVLGSVVAAISLCSCGGGGGAVSFHPGGNGGGGGTTTGTDTPLSNATARVHVDVATGQVTITGLNGPVKSPVAFRGNSIGFNSSVLFENQGGGEKVMNVSLLNNTGLTIGQNSAGVNTGLDVLFSPITEVTTLTSIAGNMQVSTFAGSTVGNVNGPLTAAKFNNPSGVAYNSNDGSLWVADHFNNSIRKISGSSVSTIAGSGSNAEKDGIGTAASFAGPFDIAFNQSDGSFVVTDTQGNKIRRVTATGSVTTIAGTGSAGLTFGAGNVATFSSPTSVTVTPNGTIYVAALDNVIRKITLTGADPRSASSYTVSLFAGNSSGTAGAADGVGTAASFFNPYGLTSDPAGNLYVADSNNNKIRFITPAAEVATIGGNGTQGNVNGSGSTAEFSLPYGIAYVNGVLVVTNQGDNRLQIMGLSPGAIPTSANNWNVANLAGSGYSGATNGLGTVATFNDPNFPCADRNGTLYVPDANNNLIRRVQPTSGTFNVGILGGGVGVDPVTLANASGDIPNSSYGLNQPYIHYTDTVGSHQASSAQQWAFYVPVGVTAFDFTVTVESSATVPIGLVPSFGVGSTNVDVRTFAGTFNTPGTYANDGAGSEALFGFQSGLNVLSSLTVACDSLGNVYVNDVTNNDVRIIKPDGSVHTIAGVKHTSIVSDGRGDVASFQILKGIAVSKDGTKIFVLDNAYLRLILTNQPGSTDPVDYYVYTIAGGSGYGTTNGPGNTASFSDPDGIALSPGGDIYVAEFNWDVRKVTFTGGDITNAANWQVIGLAGQPGVASGSQDGTGAAATFGNIYGIACDQAGNAYVTENIGPNYNIRKITPGGVVTTYETSAATVGYKDGNSTTAEFQFLGGIAADNAGNLYISDQARIRKISASGFVQTLAGTGALGYTDGPGNTAQFGVPNSRLAIGPNGDVYVEDKCCIRVLRPVVSGDVSGRARPK